MEGFSIVKVFVNFCWFIFKWGLVPGVVAAAIIVPYLYHRIDEEIRLHVEARFAEHYPDMKVRVRSAQLVEGVGIEIRGMSFSERGTNSDGGVADSALVYLEHVVLDCSTELPELMCPEVPISKVTIRRPVFRLTRRADGSWNAANLLPLPSFSDRPPEVIIEGGTVEIVDERKNPVSSFTLRDLNLRLGTLEQTDGEQSANNANARTVSGSLTGDHLRRVEFTGTFDPGSGDAKGASWDIGGIIEGLELSPELCGSLPSLAAERLRALGTFRGRGKFGFRLCNGDTQEQPLLFKLSGDVEEGRMDDPRLPYPLTNIRATICCNNDGFSVKDLFAQSGRTTLRLSGKMAGFGPEAPWEFDAEINELKLEQSLTAGLSPGLKAAWDKYNPSGHLRRVELHLESHLNGFRSDLARISVECGDVAFAHQKFPYRLEHAHGKIKLKDKILTADLTGYSGNNPIQVQAELIDPLGAAKNSIPAQGSVEIYGEHIPLDSKLFAAIKEFNIRSHTTLCRLDPHGSVGFHAKLWRDAPGSVPQKHFLIGLNHCSIKFQQFPYPIRDIVGTIERHPDGSWKLSNLEGYNDTGRITCEGWLQDTQRGKQLSLSLTGTDIPLEEELRNALRPNLQRLWDDAKPRGIINIEEIKIDWFDDEKKLDLKVVAQPRVDRMTGDSISIEPKMFPYRMEKIQGRMIYENGHVTLERFKARHGDIQMSGRGYCELPADGGWHFHLDDVMVDRLRMDRELVQALPSRLRKALVELNPSGPMYISRGSLDLKSDGHPGEPIRAGWNLAVGFHQGNIDCGLKLHNIHGSLNVKGQFDGINYFSEGELDIESLMYDNIQITDIRGPIWIDTRMAWLGYSMRKTDRSPNNRIAGSDRSRKLTGKVFGGRLEGDCRIILDGSRHYSVEATLAGADLSKCAKETMAGRQRLKGKVDAAIGLRGSGKSLSALKGRGEIRLSEAYVYELPVMISLLKILSITAPDTNAFDNSNTRFNIEGNHIYFNPIDFTGDAISLRGRGDMDFLSKKINLKFYTVVGRDKWYVPIVSPILGGASEQVLAINVTGTLQNPYTTKEIFPMAKEALQQLQADLRGANAGRTPPQGRPARAMFPGSKPWSALTEQATQRGQPVQSRPLER
ncbi:MAG: AsmA-like C-terminal domain-containing protein [Pirellulales bacterium]|nr:AsmA-like C-terminal domain-containing protein [Pirellulales bacterium]